MQSLNHYLLLIKRWIWMILLGIIICGGMTYFFSQRVTPVYQASTIIVVNVGDPASNGPTSSIAAVPTYAQLLTNPLVLNSVVAKHPGMTLQQLTAMIAVKPQTSTQLIELDVQNGNAQLAKQLANEIGQSFEHYSNGQLPGAIVVWPAQEPANPISPKPLQQAGIGALIGLGLAIALIIIFEWIEDRPEGPDAVQTLLEMEILTTIPYLGNKERNKKTKTSPVQTESYLRLSANLNMLQQARPFKLVMITSAIGGEGKSTIAANLASCLANLGKCVLLVDANMRHPELHQLFQLNNNRGLANVFAEKWSSPRPELYGQETDIQTLRVLPAGVLSSNPAEVLQTPLAKQIFEYYKHAPFDYVIFDAPPILPVIDAQILSILSDAVIFVVDITKISRKALLRAKQVLSRTHAMRLGVVINKSRGSDYERDLLYSGKGQQSQTHSTLEEMPHTPPSSSIVYKLPDTAPGRPEEQPDTVTTPVIPEEQPDTVTTPVIPEEQPDTVTTPVIPEEQPDTAPTIRLKRRPPNVSSKTPTLDKQSSAQSYSAKVSSPLQGKPPMRIDSANSFHEAMKQNNTFQAYRQQ